LFIPGAGTIPRDEAVLFLPKPRYLFVVARQHREMYDLLIERFQDDTKVEVVMDRRAATGERAGEESDRRQRRLPEDDLPRRSHLIITRTDDRSHVTRMDGFEGRPPLVRPPFAEVVPS
jgi:hypothetical protein